MAIAIHPSHRGSHSASNIHHLLSHLPSHPPSHLPSPLPSIALADIACYAQCYMRIAIRMAARMAVRMAMRILLRALISFRQDAEHFQRFWSLLLLGSGYIRYFGSSSLEPARTRSRALKALDAGARKNADAGL